MTDRRPSIPDPMTSRSRPPLVLCYHAVDDVPLRRDPHRLHVQPGPVRRQIARLRSWGYQLVTFSEIVHRAGEGRASNCATLTFDDGFADNLHTLMPLLDEMDAVATIFVVSGWLGARHPDPPHTPILSREELVTLSRNPRVEIGAHTETHPHLSVLSYTHALAEFLSCRTTLEGLIDKPVTVAAYPFGLTSAEALRACRDAGYIAACRSSGEGSWDDPFNIPRQDMSNRQTSAGFWLKRDDR